MKDSPSFSLYSADYFMDTVHWSIDEVGAYTRLLLFQWINGPLPSDERRLARITGCSLKRFQKVWSQVAVKYLRLGDGQYVNERLERSRKEKADFIQKQSESGKLGAERRWGKSDGDPIGDPIGKTIALQSSSSVIKKQPKEITPTEYPADFLSFWDAYPNKKGKKAAFIAWKRARDRPPIDAILSAIEQQRSSDKWISGFIKEPATWLNQGCWDDQVTHGSPQSTGGGNGRYQNRNRIPEPLSREDEENIARVNRMAVEMLNRPTPDKA